MLHTLFKFFTVSVLLTAFFCNQVQAYDDKNYIYIGQYNGMDYFLDAYSISVKSDKPNARTWTQKVFPIGESLKPNTARSIEQKFHVENGIAYNSTHKKNPIDEVADNAERIFLMKSFNVGFEQAFGESPEIISKVQPLKDDGKVNPELTEIVFILDRSGSMGGMEEDTIGGFNSMLERQKSTDGKAFMTTILFDDKIEYLHDRIELDELRPITREEYWVRGSTALLDAIGETIVHIKAIQKYAKPEERPAKTIFCITTDGMENASRKYDYRAVKRLIEQQKESGWEFLFLGADIDSTALAERIGIDRSRAANYKKDRRGSGLMYGAFSDAVTSMRSSGTVAEDWKDEVEEDERSR